MTKVENKELIFDEMEWLLLCAYQLKKCKYMCNLEYLNDKEHKTIVLFVEDKITEKKVIKFISAIFSDKNNKKSFNEMIEILNGEEPDWKNI